MPHLLRRTVRYLSSTTALLKQDSSRPSDPLASPPKSQSATAQQHPDPGPSSASSSPEVSAGQPKERKDPAQDLKEAEEAMPEEMMNETQYGSGEAVEGKVTKGAGEKEMTGLA